MIYSNYSNRINDLLARKSSTKAAFNKSQSAGKISGISEIRSQILREQKDFTSKIRLNLDAIQDMLSPVHLEAATLGVHPDFKHLKFTEKMAYHHIVSVFVDLQGSTALFREYDLEEIFEITNTVQSAVIHTFIALGGHIQRLQGDGVFAYFGGSAMSREKAVERALTASSMISYFMKNDLKNLFEKNGIEDINTRIGIDFGEDEKVLWANFGVDHISELTTLSLHTSLASKMQAYAKANGMVVGQNVKEKLGGVNDYFSIIKDSKGEEVKRYIFEDVNKNFRYTQYAFDWYKFLKAQPFVGMYANGDLYLKSQAPVIKKDPAPLGVIASPNRPYNE